MNQVSFVVPEGIDDPLHPSGGNRYDARIRDGLRNTGWQVGECPVAGVWLRPDDATRENLARALAGVNPGWPVLIDGLVAVGSPEVVADAAQRLRLVVLLHMPFGEANAKWRHDESTVLAGASAVIVTSGWTRDWICTRYGLASGRVHVATPGVDNARLSQESGDGGNLLCVAAVSLLKGHDLLVAALAGVADLPWRCVCAGPINEPALLDRLRSMARRHGIDDRIRYVGPLDPVNLDRAYAKADVMVLASRRESWGMVVTEALAHGVPVIATRVGGVPEALGRSGGTPAGWLVMPNSPDALSGALRRWLTDARLRERLRDAAAMRRRGLKPWQKTVAQVARVLITVTA